MDCKCMTPPSWASIFESRTGSSMVLATPAGFTRSTQTALATLVSQLTVALEGTYFGVDFNPAADRLRIISDTGQNLAHNVNPQGTTAVNMVLNYPAPVSINPALGVTGAAYTNNDLSDATGTTLSTSIQCATRWQSSRRRPRVSS